MRLSEVPNGKELLWFFDENLESELLWFEYAITSRLQQSAYIFEQNLNIDYAIDYLDNVKSVWLELFANEKIVQNLTPQYRYDFEGTYLSDFSDHGDDKIVLPATENSVIINFSYYSNELSFFRDFMSFLGDINRFLRAIERNDTFNIQKLENQLGIPSELLSNPDIPDLAILKELGNYSKLSNVLPSNFENDYYKIKQFSLVTKSFEQTFSLLDLQNIFSNRNSGSDVIVNGGCFNSLKATSNNQEALDSLILPPALDYRNISNLKNNVPTLSFTQEPFYEGFSVFGMLHEKKSGQNIFLGTPLVSLSFRDVFLSPTFSSVLDDVYSEFSSVGGSIKGYWLQRGKTQEIREAIKDFFEDHFKLKDFILEGIYKMSFLQKIDEIHACLGAGEFAYDNQANEAYMNIARRLDTLCKAYGVAFNLDGSIVATRQRYSIPLTESNGQLTATIPDGWARGQFADNKGGGTTGQLGGLSSEERTGIVYQQRSNKIANPNEENIENIVYTQGDLILCENFLQVFESYLEDLDKGLNWQEMGSSFLPSADGSQFCKIEGMGGLLAEVAYMLSAISGAIFESKNLNLQIYNAVLQNLKATGLPLTNQVLKVGTGEEGLGGEEIEADMLLPKLQTDAPNLTKQNMAILQNLAVLMGIFNEAVVEEDQEEEVEP